MTIKKRNETHPYTYKAFMGQSQRFVCRHSIQNFMAYGKVMRRIYMKLRVVPRLLKQVMMIFGVKMNKITFGERETKLRSNTHEC